MYWQCCNENRFQSTNANHLNFCAQLFSSSSSIILLSTHEIIHIPTSVLSPISFQFCSRLLNICAACIFCRKDNLIIFLTSHKVAAKVKISFSFLDIWIYDGWATSSLIELDINPDWPISKLYQLLLLGNLWWKQSAIPFNLNFRAQLCSSSLFYYYQLVKIIHIPACILSQTLRRSESNIFFT